MLLIVKNKILKNGMQVCKHTLCVCLFSLFLLFSFTAKSQSEIQNDATELEAQQVVGWQPIPDAASYIVQISTDPKFTVIQREIRVIEPKVNIEDLEIGRYFLRVAGINVAEQFGDFSSTATLTILTNPIVLSKPLHKFFSDVNELNTEVHFEWNEAVGPESYELQISRNPNFYPTQNYPSETNSLKLKLPADGKPHYWRVVGRLSDGTLSYSTSTRSLTLRYYTKPPTLITPINSSVVFVESSKNAEVIFKWAPLEGVSSFDLEVARDKIEGIKISTLKESTESSRASLAPGIYEWRVRSVDNEGRVGPWSQVWKLRVGNVLQPPIFVSPINKAVSTSSINKFRSEFEWISTVEDSKYEMHVSDDPEFKKLVKRYIGPKRKVRYALKEGTFYVRVRVGATGFKTSDWSSTRTFENKVEMPWRPKLTIASFYEYKFENLKSETSYLDGALSFSQPVGFALVAAYKPHERIALQASYDASSYSISKAFLTTNDEQKNLKGTDSNMTIDSHIYAIPQTIQNNIGLFAKLGHGWVSRNTFFSDIETIDLEVDAPLFELKSRTYRTVIVGLGVQWARTLNGEFLANFQGHYSYQSQPDTFIFFEASVSYRNHIFSGLYWQVGGNSKYMEAKYKSDSLKGQENKLTFGAQLGLGYGL